MTRERKGPLESINLRLEKNDGESFKKTVDATKAILDAIGATPDNKRDDK